MREGGAISLAVVGADYPNEDGSDRRFELALCSPGEPVDLRPEPRNKADPRAIAVFSCRGEQIGYLAAERAPMIGAIIGSGRDWQAVYQARSEFGAWIRVAFDDAEPILPPQREAQECNGEWDQSLADFGDPGIFISEEDGWNEF